MQNPSPLSLLQQRLASGDITPERVAAEALTRSNTNASQNVYLTQDSARVTTEAKAATRTTSNLRPPLYGIPISLKDCFDLRGYTTSCGSRFYADHNTPALEDSWLASQLKQAGAIITGKTHMHQLAYGITGQNADFGDCLQPADPDLLTGGSSSGAVASVQEGSALAAIGTDTGGSIRVPAALCGLAGYRASIGIGDWRGAVHLAPSFDTLGLLFRDLRDGPILAEAIFHLAPPDAPITNPTIATVPQSFLHDCEPEVLAAYATQQETLRRSGATLHEIDTAFWSEAMDIFAPIQAHEAAAIQRQKLSAFGSPNFAVFEPSIAERLTWGETFTPEAIAALRQRHASFRAAMDTILTQHDLLLLPCAPMRQLRATEDHTQTRRNILRYTTSISLAGAPAVTLPHPGGAGLQLVAARNRDAALLRYAATQFLH
ncbi:amidase [Granulicella sp. dw_53]|uniref:amidase n=1 Tax=Granulicella sp. dw_53 TaxID=2719792 RepID=UPI001BD336E0|nr:amidase [Granulicella sp. dw_53]